MDEHEYHKTLCTAIEEYGTDAQLLKASEECSELSAALLQHFGRGTPESMNHVCEEIADVHIMIDQLEMMFDLGLIEAWRDRKVERLGQRIAECSGGVKA